jgi:putative membrane protein
MRFLGNLIITAVALWLTSLLLPGMDLGESGASLGAQILTILAIALIFAVVDAIVKPILSLLALPITCLTLGLFMLVINALMLLLTAWLSGLFGLPLSFDSFWWALLAGVIVGVLTSIFQAVVGLDDTREDA